MAVTTTHILSELILVNDVDGTKTVSRTLKNIKIAAVDADVYSAAQSLISLQEPINLMIQRRNVMELEEEV